MILVPQGEMRSTERAEGRREGTWVEFGSGCAPIMPFQSPDSRLSKATVPTL